MFMTQSTDSDAPSFPRLRGATARGAVLVVGGAGRSSVRAAAALRAGLEIDWVEIEGHGTRRVEAAAERVRRGKVGAIILVEGAMLHRHSIPLLQAVRQTPTPIAYAKKGGLSQLMSAFGVLEQALG
jgi:hypothetical protein